MKRHIVALAIGSLFAVPALANNEIDAGAPGTQYGSDKAGLAFVNAEQGYVVTASDAGKSRAEVRAEVVQAANAGELIVNGELGTAQL
jgi:hypothetical protein